jgi:uncharacterized protein (DUF58 family)
MISVNRIYLFSLAASGAIAFSLTRFPLFFIFFFLLILGGYSFILMFILKKTTSFRYIHPVGIFYTCEVIGWSIVVDNIFPVPSVTIKMKDRFLPPEINREASGSITTDQNCRIENHTAFPSRGIFSLSHSEIVIEDIFRIVKLRLSFNHNDTTRIYPALYHVSELFAETPDIYQDEINRISGRENPALISDIRPYVQGDPIKKIHWKQSARQNELQVKNYERCAGTSQIILADFHESNYTAPEGSRDEEAIADVTASVAYAAAVRQISTTLFCSNKNRYTTVLNNRSGFDMMYETLLSIRSDGKLSFTDFLFEHTSVLDQMTHVTIITLNLTEEKVKKIEVLRSRGIRISAICFYQNFTTKTLFPITDGHQITQEERRIHL